MVLVGCNKPESFDCIKSYGTVVNEQVILDTVKQIHLFDGVDIYLQSGEQQKIVKIGGKNVLPKVLLTYDNGVLTIENKNSCNWVRGYKQPTLLLQVPHLSYILHKGYGRITSMDTLKNNIMGINVKDGVGDIDLTVSNTNTTIVSNSNSNITFRGSTNKLNVGYYYDVGKFNGQDLIAKNVTITHLGTNSIIVHATHKISGSIQGRGDLYVYGQPLEIDIDLVGSGQLISL